MTATFGELGVAVNAAAVAFCCALKQVLKNLAKFNPLRIFYAPDSIKRIEMAISIKQLAGTDQTIDDDTTIVRYMKLSSFLLLLADRVFLPSLRCLQSEDKLEALIPRTVWHPYGEHVQGITIPFEKWLLDHARGPTYTREPGKDHNAATLSLLAKIWHEQLSVRRCVWCWNRFTGQSHALWKIYGQRGVAILTTVGIVKRAFARLGPFRSIVSPVSYSIPRSALYEHEVGTSFLMIQKENRPYPYLFKDAGYKYEEEIRFVFGVHPNLLANANGVVTEIDGKSLLQGAIRERPAFRILISPEIPWDERVVIRRLVADILAGVRSAPIYPEGPDEERLEGFKTVSGNPFTTTDDPADLFADLD